MKPTAKEKIMKESGIVRRLDELGRIVIPKEIRKSLRIKEGTPLEISITNNAIILKKYSPILELGENATYCAEILYDILGVPIFVTDLEELVACAGAKYIKQKIKSDVVKLIDKRAVSNLENYNNTIFEEETIKHKNLFISPIIIDGDILGSIIVDYKENTSKMVDSVKFATMFASKIAN